VVVMSILMVVIGALLGAMDSMTTTEHRISGRIDDEQNARLTLAAVSRDVRAATSMLSVVPDQIDLCLVVAADGSCNTHVRWAYEAATSTLTRSLVTSTVTPTNVLHAVVNGPSGAQPFTWYGRAGSDLMISPDLLPQDMAACAVTVRSTIVIGTDRSTSPITESAEVAVHNQGNGAGCS
jgi:hypothetical protein